MHKILILVAALLAAPVMAGPNIVGLNLISIHSDAQYNDINPGVYVRWKNNTNEGVAVGAYYNSEYKVSTWAAYVYEKQWNNVSAALLIGAATGYKTTEITPMLMPSIAYHMSNSAIRLELIPNINVEGSSVLHLSVERSFK